MTDIWDRIIEEALTSQKIKYEILGHGAFEIPRGTIFSALDIHTFLERNGDLQTLRICQICSTTCDICMSLGDVNDILDPSKFDQRHIKSIGERIKLHIDAIVFCEKFERSPLLKDQK